MIIEDLRYSYGGNLRTSDAPPVFFYQFSLERRDSCGPYDALRAVLVHLVHRFGTLKDVIDQVAVLMDSEGSGQTTASDEEVSASLSLLATIPNVSLVFDAVDECEDYAHFLELLRDLCTTTSAKVLLLGRPNVELPAGFPHLSLYLDQAWNFPDIELYIQPKLSLLQDRRLIRTTLDVAVVVKTLACRAEGMFLWAWLMTQYLNCRALSPKKRVDAIFLPSIVEGLNDVYGKIIRVLDRGYQKEKDHVRKIFEIITVAIRPFHVSELEVAVAITPGTVSESSNIIVDFERTLPVICGALVGVQSDRTVRFVHSSFHDFVTYRQGRRSNSIFEVKERKAHVVLSTICLSYLTYDLPSSSICRAVSGKDMKKVKVSFPLVAYALHWTGHAVQGFGATTSKSAQELETNVQDDFYTLVTKFLNRPLSITAWIETSWIFQSKPSLAVLLSACAYATSSDSPSLFTTGDLAITMLRELSAQLEKLNSQWAHLLGKDPQKI